MFPYRLGLDVGTNSLGWSVLELNEEGKPCAVKDAGVRIFADGRVDKSKATLKADRRAARAARRRRDRFKQRRTFLLDELTKAGLFPKNPEERRTLRKLDPLELRARLITECPNDILDDIKHKVNKAKKLLLPTEVAQQVRPEYLMGRALFHLNQRRGFRSNRHDAASRDGVVKQSIKELKTKLASSGSKTLGDFLWKRRNVRETTRARRHGNAQKDLYDFYPTRDMLEHEFDEIWAAQSKWHHELLTEQKRKRIRTVIFTQRPLKPQKVGQCTYLDGEGRTFQAMPSFQRYRIYQDVNNLGWTTSRYRHLLNNDCGARDEIVDMYRGARDEIVDMLEHPTTQNGNVTFGKMKKVLKKWDLAEGNFQFNFETPKRKGFDGNHTSNLMQDKSRVGPQWHKWSLERQDAFIGIILNDELDDKKVQVRLVQDYDLTDAEATACIEAPLKDGTASLSSKAARLLLAKMKDDLLSQTKAVQKVAKEEAKFVNPFTRARDGELLKHLPYYGLVLQRHIIQGKGDEKDEQARVGMVTNPTVHIALNQICHVVNELIDRYGRPASIAIELARELPEGKQYRRGLDNAQKANQKRNCQWDDILRKEKKPITRDNRLILQLWKEQNKCCPYTGIMICRSKLFCGDFEIDHLIPFSLSLDDSPANKVLCTRESNRYKDNRTPHRAFGQSRDGYDWNTIYERAKGIKYEQQWFNRKAKPEPEWESEKKSKLWRFQENALEIWKRDHADFTSRHLNDTRYIGRLTKDYLKLICPFQKIDVVTGRLTALLRGHWGLNSVLRDDTKPQDNQSRKKNRDDHRHHAVDAIVIGMTSRSMLQTVSTAANHAEQLQLETIFKKNNGGKSVIDPWNGFRGEVREVIEKIIVSHKPSRKKQGTLHKQYAYGIADKSTLHELNQEDQDRPITTTVVLRRNITDFKEEKHVQEIRDKKLQEKLFAEFQRSGKDGFTQLARKLGIRHLRVELIRAVQPIRDKKTNEIYKAFWLRANWGTEIYEYPKGHTKAGQWEAKTIPLYHAIKKEFQPGTTYRPHPAAKLVMRLQAKDFIEIEEQDKKRFMRVQKMSKGRVHICEHQEANVANRLNEIAIEASARLLKSLEARKVHISPTGKVNYEVPRKPRRKT